MKKHEQSIKDITDILFAISTLLVALDVVLTQVLNMLEKIVHFISNL